LNYKKLYDQEKHKINLEEKAKKQEEQKVKDEAGLGIAKMDSSIMTDEQVEVNNPKVEEDN